MRFSSFFVLFFCFIVAKNQPYVVVLGIAQDGGYPQAGCNKKCCRNIWGGKDIKKVSSLGIVVPYKKKSWLIDATPDFAEQYYTLEEIHKTKIEGIFLSHAHIGHYSGLMQLGREVMGTKSMPVFSMPRMQDFLTNNAPWSQLVNLKNIVFTNLVKDKEIKLEQDLIIEPILVPHRDEFSETIGFKIMGKNNSLVYIPDIDKWNIWERDIVKIILNNDFVLIDGTFYTDDEIPDRNMSEIPHPFIYESIKLFSNLGRDHRSKIFFTHLNHTNPAIVENSAAYNFILSKGFNLLKEAQIFKL